MKMPNTKAASMLTRCGSFRHQKPITSNSRSGAGPHSRHGNNEISQISKTVNQMNSTLEDCLKGDVSIGCKALNRECLPAVAGIQLFGLRTMRLILLLRWPRVVDPHTQKMTMTLGVRERRSNSQCKARRGAALDVIHRCHRQASRKQAADPAGDQRIARGQVDIGR